MRAARAAADGGGGAKTGRLAAKRGAAGGEGGGAAGGSDGGAAAAGVSGTSGQATTSRGWVAGVSSTAGKAAGVGGSVARTGVGVCATSETPEKGVAAKAGSGGAGVVLAARLKRDELGKSDEPGVLAAAGAEATG